MKRWAFNVAAGVSLAMCLATAALWARSYWVFDAYNWEDGGGSHPYRFSLLISINGILSYECQYRDRSTTWPPRRGYFEYWTGIKEISSPMSQSTTAKTHVQFPHAGMMAILATVPLVWLMRMLRDIRDRRRGHCRICGYDLRATPDRCPECGADVEKAHA